MTKGADGVWSCTTQPLAPEIYGYSFVVDGASRIDPENHDVTRNLVYPAGNVLTVPGDTPQLWDETAVPHGAVHVHRFTSKIAQGLPSKPGGGLRLHASRLRRRAPKPYPVLYLLHGWSGERCRLDQGTSRPISSSTTLLAQGRIKPMVVVNPQAYGDMSFVQSGDRVWSDRTTVEHKHAALHRHVDG